MKSIRKFIQLCSIPEAIFSVACCKILTVCIYSTFQCKLFACADFWTCNKFNKGSYRVMSFACGINEVLNYSYCVLNRLPLQLGLLQ